jgi:Gas vesicle synthesis protein GvpL/GvpF
MVLLVHGIVRSEDADLADVRVPDGLRPRAVTAGPVAAVVSPAPDRELTPEDAAPHLDLLVAAVAADLPVLPVAFGTVAPDDDAVRDEVLVPEADVLERRLEAVADLVELRLDLTFDTDASVAAAGAADPALHDMAERARQPGAGFAEKLALGEATALRVAEHQDALVEEWTGELEELAERSAVLHGDEQLRRIAYLVPRDRLDDADGAVSRMQDGLGDRARIEYVGPLPVYSFLDELDVRAEPQPTSRWGW